MPHAAQVGYSCLVSRPRHEKQDLAAQKKFKDRVRPFFVKTVREALAPCGGKVREIVMEEARFGQRGITTRIWARTGSRPAAVK